MLTDIDKLYQNSHFAAAAHVYSSASITSFSIN